MKQKTGMGCKVRHMNLISISRKIFFLMFRLLLDFFKLNLLYFQLNKAHQTTIVAVKAPVYRLSRTGAGTSLHSKKCLVCGFPDTNSKVLSNSAKLVQSLEF